MVLTPNILLAIVVGVVCIPLTDREAIAEETETRIYMMASGSEDEQEALDSSLKYFRSEVTKLSDLTFTPDKEIDSVLTSCRETIGVNSTEDRDCRLQAARRVMVDQVLEIVGSKGKKSWELWVRVLDPEGKLLFEDFVEIDGKDLKAAAKEGLPLLAHKYLCNVHSIQSACAESTDVAPPNSVAKNAVASASGGRLEIVNVTPSPVIVLANGLEVGNAPGQLLDLPLGDVEVTLRSPGYDDLTQQMTFTEAKMESLAGITLTPKPGVLVVSCNIEGASVKINGSVVSSTRAGGEIELDVPAGPTRVHVWREGYAAVVKNLEISGGERVSVSVELHAPPKAPLGYVYIQPGTFTMGSPSSEEGREPDETQHDVAITQGIFVKATEVTQNEWTELMGNNPSNFRLCGSSCPVDSVSWYDALAFCNLLSKSEGVDQCYDLSGCSGTPGVEGYTCPDDLSFSLSCTGYRLPTEAEWEYAARAGATTAIYTGDLTLVGERNSPELGKIAVYGGNSRGGHTVGPLEAVDCSKWSEKEFPSDTCSTSQVGFKGTNNWGLSDVLGNVYEWTWDWKGDYPASPDADDPLGSANGEERVTRGGSWKGKVKYTRLATRGAYKPSRRGNTIGFRPIQTVDGRSQ